MGWYARSLASPFKMASCRTPRGIALETYHSPRLTPKPSPTIPNSQKKSTFYSRPLDSRSWCGSCPKWLLRVWWLCLPSSTNWSANSTTSSSWREATGVACTTIGSSRCKGRSCWPYPSCRTWNMMKPSWTWKVLGWKKLARGGFNFSSIFPFWKPKRKGFQTLSTTEIAWGPGNAARHGAAVAARAANRRAQRWLHGPLRRCGDSHDPRGAARPWWRGSAGKMRGAHGWWQLIPLRCHQWRWKILQKMEVWMGTIAINGGVSMSTFDYRRVFDGTWPRRHGTKNNDFSLMCIFLSGCV